MGTSAGNGKYIEAPEKLEEYWEAYKKQTKSNPDMIAQLSNKGEIVYVPHERPYQYDEFEAYLSRAMIKDGYEQPLKTLRHYRENKTGAYDEYCHVVTRIEQDWKADNVSGTLTGKYKAASLVGRIHNIVETKNVNLKTDATPFNPFDVDVPGDNSTG